ncbi:MAG: hypothetical protein KatS3mg085_194 [Candidatus Dojkabacteria bacterium]|nr:MAG: hypothetical protein KatS3mg085_194 [Candidatus Dojkabacteria bacterium]
MQSLRNLILLLVIVSISATGGYFLYTEILKEKDTTEEVENNEVTEQQNIVEVLLNENLSTLVTAIDKAELRSTLETGEYTVFAPTNEAFSTLGDTLDNLLKDENKESLQDVLKYHVVMGKVRAEDLKNNQSIETLSGGKLTVLIENDNVYLQDESGQKVMVVKVDLEAENGVVHVIDRVLLK